MSEDSWCWVLWIRSCTCLPAKGRNYICLPEVFRTEHNSFRWTEPTDIGSGYTNINLQKFTSEVLKQQDNATMYTVKECPNYAKHLNLYLAKIYNHEENQRKEENNLTTALLIEPDNEEVLLMLMKIALKKSNYAKVKDISQTFVKVCDKLCDENNEIQKSLKNIEPENES